MFLEKSKAEKGDKTKKSKGKGKVKLKVEGDHVSKTFEHAVIKLLVLVCLHWRGFVKFWKSQFMMVKLLKAINSGVDNLV